jgi:hypothetical protein
MSDCIIWPLHVDKDGYGKRTYLSRNGQLAHRVAYEIAHGPIPDARDVDHTCFVRACVNVEHLRLLPVGLNRGLTRRSLKTLCIRGHRLDVEANLLRRPGHPRVRICRSCLRERASTTRASA